MFIKPPKRYVTSRRVLFEHFTKFVDVEHYLIIRFINTMYINIKVSFVQTGHNRPE